jgi:hypothetical protein
LLGVGCVSLALFGCGFLVSGAWLIATVTFLAVALYVSGRYLNPTAAKATTSDRLRWEEWMCIGILAAQAVS